MALKKKAAVKPKTDEPVKEVEPAAEVPAATKTAAPAPEAQPIPEQAPAPVAEETPVVETPAPSTEMAAPVANQVAQGASAGGALAHAAEEGFGGLEIGFGSFPILKIDGESFDLDGEELEEKEVLLQIFQSRKRILIKQKDAGDDAEFIYSYDGQLTTSGDSVPDWVTKQNLAGFDVEYKEYVECVAEILDEGELEGEIILLSIPPSGGKRFSGYVAKLQLRYGITPKEVVTQAFIGKKIKKGTTSWCPWGFKFIERLEE